MRRAVAFECAVQSELWDDVVQLPASNLSEEGMWIESPIGLEPGEPLILSFTPPGTHDKVWAAAKVVRRSRHQEREQGIALVFTYCSEPHREVLARALYGQPPRLPKRPQPPPLPTSVRSLGAIRIVSESLPEITHGPAPSDAILATVVSPEHAPIADLGRATMQVMDEEVRVELTSASATIQVRDDELAEA
ncbi:MAG TPA: PilZ domain-containing protein [Polyangiales bacterium]|nr:PilZ domain-containing protein [Polyangiales bacterium]